MWRALVRVERAWRLHQLDSSAIARQPVSDNVSGCSTGFDLYFKLDAPHSAHAR